VSLQDGTNVITVTAQDAAGNRGTDTLTVAYSAPTAPTEPIESPSIVLSGSFYASGKWSKVFLKWTIVKGRYVDVYRNNVRVTRTANDGSYADAPRGEGPYTYRLCITGTGICSNSVSVSR
jgi:hypothetical protein